MLIMHEKCLFTGPERCRRNHGNAGSEVILCNVNGSFRSPDISVISCLTLCHLRSSRGKAFSLKSREGIRVLQLKTHDCEVTQDTNQPGVLEPVCLLQGQGEGERERERGLQRPPEKWSRRPCSPCELDVQQVLGSEPRAGMAGLHVGKARALGQI